jgi:feruloyl esterase
MMRLSGVALLALAFWSIPARAETACARLDHGEVHASAAPDHCAVTGHLHPVPGSDIGFVLWLPQGWNGRFQMFGNGGYSSTLPLAQMRAALAKGYAVAATDTGHDGDDPAFARGHPQAIADWAWRAVHETAIAAQRLTRAYYGRRPTWRYFWGCSTGGQQALSEAQRFPADFDGIVAGAPGYDRIRLNAGFLWMFLQNHHPGDNAHPILAQAQLDLLAAASQKACGSGEPWLDDPLACRFDPAVLHCRDARHDACLTADQVAAAAAIYRGAQDEAGHRAFFGWAPGTERQWSIYWADPRDASQPIRANFWRDWVFHDPQWNWWRFSFGRDLAAARQGLSTTIDADSADLSRFAARGGKLLHWHGLADPVVPVADSLAYQSRVSHRVGDAARFYRLFLIPGVGHCGGGPGPDQIATQDAIEAWVERDEAPKTLSAHQKSGRIFAVAPHGAGD